MEKPRFGYIAGVSLAMHAAVASAVAGILSIAGFGFALAFVIFLYIVAVGFLPVVLYAAPAYTLLAQTGFARWYYALLLGIAPGVAVLPFDTFFGLEVIGYGAAVALLTHLVCRQRYRLWMEDG